MSTIDRPRVMPVIDALNRPFWMSGRTGSLHLWRCQACRYFSHPPSTVCRRCWSTDLVPEPVSGRGRLVGWTIDQQAPVDDVVPSVIGLVSLDDQPDLQMIAEIDARVQDLVAGRAVTVAFQPVVDLWFPYFELVAP